MSMQSRPVFFTILTLIIGSATAVEPANAAGEGKVKVSVVDAESGQPIPVRMHLKNSRGKPVIPRGTVSWKDHFILDGEITLKLRPDDYTFQVERGPEYKIRHGNFHIERRAEDHHEISMHRFVDMSKEGWWSGDLHVHRPPKDIELLMRAEDLHVAPVITWWNNRNIWADKTPPASLMKRFDDDRLYHLMAGEDEREGGALLYFNLHAPLPIAGSSREYPSPVKFLNMARMSADVHVDIEKPFWWDMPVWVATGKVDSIGIAHNHMQRDGVLGTEAWGKPRDRSKYLGAHGNGQWTQDIYYHLLNCGLRIPPSAGSASGVLPNPVGYNRVYVYCGDELTYNRWWDGLRAGQVVVTNGPLLRPLVNGELPGHVFRGQGGVVELDVALKLSLRDKVDYLEIVKNGRVIHQVRLKDYAKAGGHLPKVVFQSSGWMLVRAIAKNPDTFRFASTGPYYVEIDDKPRISRQSAQFFLDWVHERARRIKLDDAEQKKEVIAPHRMARDFWQAKVDAANAD
jgi:hypothetical protein